MSRYLAILFSLFLIGFLFFLGKGGLDQGDDGAEDSSVETVTQSSVPKLTGPLYSETEKERAERAALSDQIVDQFVEESSQGNKTTEEKKAKIIEEYMDSSGVGEEILALDEIMEEQLSLLGQTDLDDSEREKLEKVVSRIFNSKKILKQYLNEMKKNFSVEELEIIKNTAKNPLIEYDARVKESLSSQDGQRDFYEFSKKLQEEPLSPKRLELLNKLDELSNTSDNTLKIIDGIMKNYEEPLTEALEADKLSKMSKEQKDQMNIQKSQFKAQLQESIKKGILQNYAYVNAQWSDEELAKKNDLLAQEAVMKENQIRNKILFEAIANEQNGKEYQEVMKSIAKSRKK